MTEHDDALATPPGDATTPPAPPRKWWIAYRLFDRRIPTEYGRWLVADLHRPGWTWRTTFTRYFHMVVELVALLFVVKLTYGRYWTPLLVGLGALALMAPYDLMRARRRPSTVRAEVLARQGIDADGNELVLDSFDRFAKFKAPARAFSSTPGASAMLYVVTLVAVLGGTAAVGISKNNDLLTSGTNGGVSNQAAQKPKRPCVKVPKDIETAIERTIKEEGADVQNPTSTKYGQGIAVAGYVTIPGKKGLSFGGWLVEGAASTYSISQVDLGKTEFTTSVTKVQMSEPGDRIEAFTDAVRCLAVENKPPTVKK